MIGITVVAAGSMNDVYDAAQALPADVALL
jgi:hypothetical protein